MNKGIKIGVLCLVLCGSIVASAQEKKFIFAEAESNGDKALQMIDGNLQTGWSPLNGANKDQALTLTLSESKNVNSLDFYFKDNNISGLDKMLDVFITYDPQNLGNPVSYKLTKLEKGYRLSFDSKYGNIVRLILNKKMLGNGFSVNEVVPGFAADKQGDQISEAVAKARKEQAWMDKNLPAQKRVELLMKAMTPAEKIGILRESWGIAGLPELKIPAVTKVEAIHGFSYGSGATIFPQSIAQGATWNKALIERMAEVIGEETKSANTVQVWSPVLDVTQDARWGRAEETYGEDPVLVSEIGGAWVKGIQSRGIITTPKHFAVHGAPLGGRDSHDIGLSEREYREIHLVPFRNIIKKYKPESLMMAYSDYAGVPVAKSWELLNGVLREEWGFDGFIVSDCGAIGNLTSRKHYTAENVVTAAQQALGVSIAVNCGDTYNNKEVINAVKNGVISAYNLDSTTRTLLKVMFRQGYFENNPSKKLDWNKIYPGWNTPEHKELAREVARQSIVLLRNKNNTLPLKNNGGKIAVLGPGADDLQPGDYTAKAQPNQLVSVLKGIEAAAGKENVLYEQGCDFTDTTQNRIDAAVKLARESAVAVLVLGDRSSSETIKGVVKTSGENSDYSSLILPGFQQRLLEAVAATGKPVVLVLQSGRPYDLSFASQNVDAIIVNWLPGQEGGYAAADVLFGKYNPAGRLPMTFPRHAAQLPLYYNFKTSGRRYNYVDDDGYPLYKFGFGLSYTQFKYSNLKTTINNDGSVAVQATVTNTGKIKGDEVAQLYLTDMYASVKTRIMELKDFTRISLNPGESKLVSFVLNSYQLSLLDDKMDRRVEPGTFRVFVGGKSPDYKLGDYIKNSIKYASDADGLSTELDYQKSFAANFDIKIGKADIDTYAGKNRIAVSIKNSGNLNDVGRVTMFVDGVQQEYVHHYELDPGTEKTIYFLLDKKGFKNLTFTTKYKSVSKTFSK